MFRNVRKAFFTLFELVIVLMIISFGMILTGVKLSESYSEQRFLSETQQILSHLAMAQDLMLIMNADVQVKLEEDSKTKQVACWIEVEKPLEDSWARLIERKLSFSAIRSFQFENSSDKPLILHFKLGKMSKGTLTLSEGVQNDSNFEKKRKYQIELLGYPASIGNKRSENKEQNRNHSDKIQLLYPVEVYEELYKQK